MQQRPNRPVSRSSRPSPATRRPDPARRSVSSPGRPPKRRLTRREIEMLRRRRRREKIRNLSLLAVIVVLIVGVSAWVLRPRDNTRSVIARTPGEPTAAPVATEVPAETPEPTELPAETEAPAQTEAPAETEAPAPTEQPSALAGAQQTSGLRSVHFRVTGDLMVTDEQLAYAKAAGGGTSYNFEPCFDLIRESLQSADYTMGNMETTIGKYTNSKGQSKDYSGYPLFNSPESLLDAAKNAGYDFFTLANNHMLDRWFDGMKNTVGWIEQYGFAHVGAYRTQEERNTPVVIEIGGIKFGFVAYTHSTNTQERVCDEAAQIYGVPYLYKADIEGDIQRLRDAGAEVVIAFPHWGDEYVREPDANQQKYCKRLAQAGADVILGSHSHTVEPMGFFDITDNSGRNKRVFAIYSLGNFLSSHTLQYTDSGIILDFTIQEQPDGSFACTNVGYVPTYCWQDGNSLTIVPTAKYLNNPPSGMDSASYARMKETYVETTTLLGSEFTVLES